ncbi:hypothetical protein YTPLAS18_24630 [Nitrospira sp.]|nr:hypothetical protein YTPLAS18_24630 [Nitrospira sp.]
MERRRPRMRQFKVCRAAGVLLGMVLAVACSRLPSLDEQTGMVARGEWRHHQIVSEAVLKEWGTPDYSLVQRTQFYPLTTGNWIPEFRVGLGEYPKEWDLSMVLGDGLFLAYADRETLLGFYEDRLVYHEHMPPEAIHALGKQWQRDSLFRTRLEGSGKRP